MRAAHHSRTAIARRLDEPAPRGGGALDAADGRPDHREPRLHGAMPTAAITPTPRRTRRSSPPRSGRPANEAPVRPIGTEPEAEPARWDRPLRRLPLPARPWQEPLRPHQRECDSATAAAASTPPAPARHPASVQRAASSRPISRGLWRTQMAEEAFLVKRDTRNLQEAHESSQRGRAGARHVRRRHHRPHPARRRLPRRAPDPSRRRQDRASRARRRRRRPSRRREHRLL